MLIKKETIKIDKNGNDEIIEILYKIKFIDCFGFTSTSLSNLNLSEGVHNDKCTDCKSYLYFMSIKDKKFLGVLNVKRTMKKTLMKN